MKVLIVDDSASMRMIVKRTLKQAGFANLDFCEAENGQEALTVIDDERPTLILCDWNMPVMNGIEFIIELRARPDGNVPKVVFCTTENDVDHIREAMNAGADEYVMKPFDHETLQIKLQLIGFE